MPTIILIDVSLSMLRPVLIPDCTETYQRRQLATHGINSLLDYMAHSCKLEFTSLMAFSSLWEIVQPFTRDYETLKSALSKIENYDRTCIDIALEGVRTTVLEEWGAGTPCQVVLITDGSIGTGYKTSKFRWKDSTKSSEPFPLPFPFSSKLFIMCISQPDEATLQTALPFYQHLIETNNGDGQIFVPEGPLSLRSVQQLFTKLVEQYFVPFHGTITCGNLSSHIQLFPPPEPYSQSRDFEIVKRTVASKIDICGFLEMNDVASPAAYSRHLVLPSTQSKNVAGESNGNMKNDHDSGDDDVGSSDDGKTASFCVLLHGSLKVEGMIALCHLGEDWYGMLYSWADSKKKSNLMLTVYEPGILAIPWVGTFNRLAPLCDFEIPPYGDDDNSSPFPLKPSEKRSYAQSCVVWIRQSGLQADIQKILRYARKLPDKTQNFYKELNRLRKAALSFGFLELLERMASILERECTLLPGGTHPEAALQLTHAVNVLRSPQSREYSQNVLPLRTKFSSDD